MRIVGEAERVGISEAVLITGLSDRKLREMAPIIPGASKGLSAVNTPAWLFDEELLRGWVAGTVESAQGEARRKALSGRFPCPFYMSTMRTWLREPNRIYFIQAGEQHIKIGVAFKPANRMRELQVGNPFQLHLRAEINGNRQREMYLHEFYANERARGEWFEPSERLLAYIEKING